jgi:hypothetical protein
MKSEKIKISTVIHISDDCLIYKIYKIYIKYIKYLILV